MSHDGIVSCILILVSVAVWTRSFFQWLYYSWEWWILLIVGLWNAPDSRTLWAIFLYPTWVFDKPQLPPRELRKYYSNLQWKLDSIATRQQFHFKTMFSIVASSAALRLIGGIFHSLLVATSISELILQILWYSGRIIAYWIGLLQLPNIHTRFAKTRSRLSIYKKRPRA